MDLMDFDGGKGRRGREGCVGLDLCDVTAAFLFYLIYDTVHAFLAQSQSQVSVYWTQL